MYNTSRENNKADLGNLYETIERIRSKTPGNSDVVFGMEATGIYSLPRTDPIDSAIIADMLRHSEPPQGSEIQD